MPKICCKAKTPQPCRAQRSHRRAQARTGWGRFGNLRHKVRRRSQTRRPWWLQTQMCHVLRRCAQHSVQTPKIRRSGFLYHRLSVKRSLFTQDSSAERVPLARLSPSAPHAGLSKAEPPSQPNQPQKQNSPRASEGATFLLQLPHGGCGFLLAPEK